MLTINNNNNGNKQSFTSTFRLIKPNKYEFEYMNKVLNNLRKAVVPSSKFNGKPRSREYSASSYCSQNVNTIYFDQYLSKKANKGFSGGRDIFFFETERPLKTKHVSGSNPPRREIVYGDKSPYDKVTVSVPDEKDSVIQQLLDSVGIKYTAKKLPSEKSVKYVLINSDELKKKGGILWKAKIINYFREFQQGEIIADFLDTVAQPFRILTARADKSKSGIIKESELELRVPRSLMPKLRAYLKKEKIFATFSDKPKYLNYA